MNEQTYPIALAVAIVIGSWLLGLLFCRVGAGRIKALFPHSHSNLEDMLLAAFGRHVPLWFLLIGLTISMRYLGLAQETLRVLDRVALAAAIVSITMATASFAAHYVAHRGQGAAGGLPTTTLTQNAVRIMIMTLGGLMVLSNLGVTITPVLTALGVGSLAVALALQPTLTNFFAGFHISLARQIRVGDFVELETGQQGFVSDIGWRSTEIIELANNLVLIPNARLAEIVVRNFARPEPPEHAVVVQVGVSPASDLARVEAVTQEVARETLQTVPGAVTGYDPLIRYHALGETAVNFTVTLCAQNYPERFLLIHEFIKRLHARYAQEGIERRR